MSAATPSLAQQRRYFAGVAVVMVVLGVTFGVLLLPSTDPDLRSTASATGLAVAGSVAIVGSSIRVRWSYGRRRRAWSFLLAAAAVAFLGNAWVTVVDGSAGGPGYEPSTVSNVSLALGLLLTIVGLVNFPSENRRGLDLAIMCLDGLIIAVAVLMAAAGVVYPELFGGGQGLSANRLLFGAVIPTLDVVLVAVALLLIRRSRGRDRPTLVLLATGFVLYAVTDLTFAVRVAGGDFAFGSLLDMGWIVGYLVLVLGAAWPSVHVQPRVGSPWRAVHVPSEQPAARTEGTLRSETLDSALVFGVLLVALVVEFTIDASERLQGNQAAFWIVLIVCAGVRQTLLTRANFELRSDLENRVRAQTADLRQLARETEVLLSSVGDGIYGVDLEGHLTFLNPSGAEALGLTLEDIGGRSAHDVFHAPPDDGSVFPAELCYIAEAIESGTTVAAEEDVYLRANGNTFPVEISASPLFDDVAGEVTGAVVVFRDVTQRREVDRMKNEFLSVVSHELRTPLTSIRGSLGLLSGGALGELTPRAGAMVDRALVSSERLTRMINDILDLERIESGTRPLDREVYDADTLVNIAVQEMSGLSGTTGVELVAETSRGQVQVERDRIVQTLTNLIGNAVKFSERGASVVVDARLVDDEVLFRVCDHGRGIPADRLGRIFERFEQVDSSDSRQKGGTGLGLAISRSIVESHGGRIWAESEVGIGTTVSFCLPAVSTPAVRGHEQPVA